MLRGTQGCFPLWSGAVLGEEGHRTAPLLREAPSRQDRGPGTCPPKGRGRAVGSLEQSGLSTQLLGHFAPSG